MPVKSQPTDQPTGRIITDEQSLERLFRAHYQTLMVEARTKLPGAEVAAPRVVSKAFHQAWNDRAQFSSQEELMAYLKAAIQHGAVREVSRRAGLHRADQAISGNTASGEIPTNLHDHHVDMDMPVDEAWDRLQHTLHGGAPEAYRKRASIARHEAAEHMADLGHERSWKPLIAVAAVALVAIVAVVWLLDRQGRDIGVARAIAASDARKYESAYNQYPRVTLGDSTAVQMGPESRITVPAEFGPELRAVGIEGIAHFDVRTTMEMPFEVRSGPVAIVATGTQFTVRRYPADSAVLVHVKEGAVEVRWMKERRQLTGGMGVVVTDAGVARVPNSDEVTANVSWVDGTVSMAGKTLREILPELYRWFGLDVKVADTTLLAREVFLTAPVGGQRSAITAIEQSGRLKFTYAGEQMTFVDAAPAPAAPRRR